MTNSNTTPLEQQSSDYADARLEPYGTTLLKAEAKALIAEAYEQGWVDRDTRDMKPETFDKTSVCKWHSLGYCVKAMPGVECDTTKCVCYTKKGKSQYNRYMENIKIKVLEIAGLGSVLKALHLPYGKECRSEVSFSFDTIGNKVKSHFNVEISGHDKALLSALVRRGDQHAKVLRGLVVWLEIEAPVYFYRELETYRFGRERLSCESTMHIDCKGLSGDELEKAKAEIPMGKMQRTVDMYSYQALRRIYFQRRDHRLPIWRKFCDFITTLPFADELITGEK